MDKLVFRCHQCGTAIEVDQGEKVLRHHTCSNCDADLKCCLHCRFYDTSRNKQCTETEADWVSDKEAANFCDYFEPNPNSGPVGGGSSDDEARSKFDDLFK